MVEQKFLCTCHHMMMVHIMEQKIPVYLSSGDEGGSSWTKNSCFPVITWWWSTSWEQKLLVHLFSCDDSWMLWNKKFLCNCHHGIRVDVVEQKFSCAPVITWWQVLVVEKSSCGPVIIWWVWMLWNKKFLCTCHHVMTVDILGTKSSCAPVITRWGWMSWNEKHFCAPVITWWGWMLWNKKFLWTCHHVMTADVLGTQNSCAPVIMWLGWMRWNKKFLRTCHHVMVVLEIKIWHENWCTVYEKKYPWTKWWPKPMEAKEAKCCW